MDLLRLRVAQMPSIKLLQLQSQGLPYMHHFFTVGSVNSCQVYGLPYMHHFFTVGLVNSCQLYSR